MIQSESPRFQRAFAIALQGDCSKDSSGKDSSGKDSWLVRGVDRLVQLASVFALCRFGSS